jgi:hypothetical protein
MRDTPKISDSPTATRNSVEALASPLSSWTNKLLKDTGALAY